MPSIASDWFAANFGGEPQSFVQAAQLGRTDIPATSRISAGSPYDTNPRQGLATQYAPDVIEQWRQANEARVTATRNLAQVAGVRAAQNVTTRRIAQAAQREKVRKQVRRALDTTVFDWSKANMPTTKQIETARMEAQKKGQNIDMITPSSVAKDLGRNLTSLDPFWTGQFETKTEGIYGSPRTREEFMLDTGQHLGTRTTKTPIVVQPRYRDNAGEAMRYAYQYKMSQRDIQSWQDFFRAKGDLKPGSFQFGAWDVHTQQAMYKLMGEANAMGQDVKAVRAAYEHGWKAMGGDPSMGFGSSGGAGSAPRDTTQTVYSITSLAKGGELLRAFLQQELGRDPDKSEIAAYVRLLNGQERKNPTITKTHYSASGAVSTSTVQEANVDPQDSARTLVTGDMKKELEARRTMEYMTALSEM